MNWILLTTISLILANSFNIGLACGNNTGTTQAQFDKVEVQAQADFTEAQVQDGDVLTKVPGSPSDLVADTIPTFFGLRNWDDFEPGLAEFTGGLITAINIVNLQFKDGTTVAEANQILQDFDAVIVGAVGIGSLAHLILRVPTNSQEELISLLEEMRAYPYVLLAGPEVVLGDLQPKLSPEEPEIEPEDYEQNMNNSNNMATQTVTNPSRDGIRLNSSFNKRSISAFIETQIHQESKPI